MRRLQHIPERIGEERDIVDCGGTGSRFKKVEFARERVDRSSPGDSWRQHNDQCRPRLGDHILLQRQSVRGHRRQEARKTGCVYVYDCVFDVLLDRVYEQCIKTVDGESIQDGYEKFGKAIRKWFGRLGRRSSAVMIHFFGPCLWCGANHSF